MSAGYVYLRPLQLVAVRAQGPYLPSSRKAWSQILEWREKTNLQKKIRRGFGLMLDDPRTVPQEECRYDACVELTPEIEDLVPEQFVRTRLPGGAFAQRQHLGIVGLGDAISSLRDGWVPSQGLMVDPRRPFVEIHLDDPTVVPLDQHRIHICVPVTLAATIFSQGTAA